MCAFLARFIVALGWQKKSLHPPLSRCGEKQSPFVARDLWSEDDFQYAAENTQVILAPEHQIATFGSTSFRFYLISEEMNRVNEVRIADAVRYLEQGHARGKVAIALE